MISVQERASYMGRVRDMAKGSCAAWMQHNGWLPKEGKEQTEMEDNPAWGTF